MIPSGKQAREILEHQEQVIRIRRAGLEFPRFVPVPRGIVFGMHKQAANSGDVGSLCRTQDRILEQCLSVAASFRTGE